MSFMEYLKTAKEGMIIGAIIGIAYSFFTKTPMMLGFIITLFTILMGSLIDYGYTAIRGRADFKNMWFWIFLVLFGAIIVMHSFFPQLFVAVPVPPPSAFSSSFLPTLGKGLAYVGIGIIALLGLKLAGGPEIVGKTVGTTTGTTMESFMSSIPIWGWGLGILILIIIIKNK